MRKKYLLAEIIHICLIALKWDLLSILAVEIFTEIKDISK